MPVNVTYTPASALDATGHLAEYRGVAMQRPNLVGDPSRPSGASRIDQYWNKSAFALPTAGAPFGNVSRNAFRGPGFWQMDLGINKRFTIPGREGLALQFRSEFFNILNHTNFGNPWADITSTAFGTIRSALPARQIQFGLKLSF